MCPRSGATTSRRTAPILNKYRRTLGLALLLAACAAGDDAGAPARPAAADARDEIVAMLEASAESWSRGDLDGVLDDYLDTEETTFVGGSGVVRGTDEIRRRYTAGYWSTGRPEHRLRFDAIEVRPLGDDHALAIGRYILESPDTGETAATGFFTLVLTRTHAGWKILHDHSSASS